MRNVVFVALAAMAGPAYLLGVDGQVLISQAQLTAAGGTYTITSAGSYKLSGNLTVGDLNASAIVIAHDNVTIDLNGFSISGPFVCAGGPLCGLTGAPNTGHGIRAGGDIPAQAYFNITIRNGTIQGMGADGIHLIGDNIVLEDLRIRNNALSGILVRSTGAAGPGQSSFIARHNTIQLNGGYGIKTYGGLIADNTIDQSGSDGISVQSGGNGGATVARNVVTRSSFFAMGLFMAGYYGNTAVNNNGGGIQIVGGVNLGQNLCNAAACP